MKLVAIIVVSFLCMTALAAYNLNESDYEEDTSASLPGLDRNNDGVRDDIEHVIRNMDLTNYEKMTFLVYAKHELRLFSLNPRDQESVQAHFYDMDDLGDCMMNHIGLSTLYNSGVFIQAKILNTESRNNHYNQYMETAANRSKRKYIDETCTRYGL